MGTLADICVLEEVLVLPIDADETKRPVDIVVPATMWCPEWCTSKALQDGEKKVDTAGVQLDSLALKLTDVERNLDENELESLENESVMELLESVTEVKNEYQNLRKDLQEVQQLQKEMTNSLRYQLRNMTQTFRGLKKKIESNSIPVHLVPPPAGSSSRGAGHEAREAQHHAHPPGQLLLPQPDLTVHDHGPRRVMGGGGGGSMLKSVSKN
uniref:Ska2 N-terminal domain-containing protein n=1 Tax=Anopheles maculatus TaxID=74869 RepID=A0A182S5U0_9DIPT